MEKQIIELISRAFEIESSEISIESTSYDIDEWDSLGHLSVLQELDIEFDDITERVPELASVSSVKEIVDLVIADKIK